MRVILRWTCSQTCADVRLARFKKVLRAAQRTQWYLPVLEEAGLATLDAVWAIDSVEGGLERLPAVDLNEFRGSPEAFENPAGRRIRLQAFRSPLEHTPKTAILGTGFNETSCVKTIPDNRAKNLRRFGATALAAPLHMLLDLAAAIESGREDIPTLRHFVVPFTGADYGEMGAMDRESLWRAFQVPVFEQRMGFDGRVIAYECEAHDGLHMLPEEAAFEKSANSELLLTSLTDLHRPTLRVGTRVACTIYQECCDCANTSARMVLEHLLPAAA